ncbi:MAG: DUF1150 domain-containing protein [Alphaproteobacteria bacterium]|nr:MAG: DUF1150 domain-containing protein [Alphaproteobacteria bacterium]
MRDPSLDPRLMSAEELTALGMSEIVYVKPVMSDDVKAADREAFGELPSGLRLFSVHTADGTPVALLDDRETAFAAARQYSMQPVSVH